MKENKYFKELQIRHNDLKVEKSNLKWRIKEVDKKIKATSLLLKEQRGGLADLFKDMPRRVGKSKDLINPDLFEEFP